MKGARDPFHEGERLVQERTGERAAALRTGAILGPILPPGAPPFLAEQQMLAVATLDEEGGVSASALFGPPGFVSSPDGGSVLVRRFGPGTTADARTWRELRPGSDVGLLAIDLASRRRLRMNGRVRTVDFLGVEIALREAYPNCRKYVQSRRVRADDGPPSSVCGGTVASGGVLDEPRVRLVEGADTFFVASHHPERGADVSHRGGLPGFVRVVDPRRLRIPDYPGNSMFNTLGNFLVDDRAGLAFIDFERGRLLQMTGTVTVRLDGDEDPRQPTGGTGRYWDFHVTHWVDGPIVPRVTWASPESPSHNPGAPL